MENIKDLISENKFIRVDKEGQHIENIDEYASQNLNDVLKGLNRHPGDLISLFERTQNQKFLNDIGLAYIAEYYYGQMINLKKELKYQIDGYENELTTLKEQNAELENKLNSNKDIDNEIETYKDIVKKAEEDKNVIKTQLNEYKQKLNNSELAYEELRQKYVENSNKIKEITELETALAKVKESNQNLNTSYEKVTNECNDLKDNISVLQKKYNDISEELEKKYKEELDKSRQKIESLQMDYNKLEDTYKVDTQKTKEIEDKYNNAMMVINSIKNVLLNLDSNDKVVESEVKANKSQDNNEMIPDNNEVTSIAKTFGLHNMPSLI